MEAAFKRGWTDGLPVVPPTERRVMTMLEGTTRSPQDVVAVVPPDMVGAGFVEKVAINAVLAGCKPEYLPVVLAALEAACPDKFNAHGLLATTMPSGPVLIVNGPIRRALGMNSGMNVFGQGTRRRTPSAELLSFTIRNISGGRPSEVDRAPRRPSKIALVAGRGRGCSVDAAATSTTSAAQELTELVGAGPRDGEAGARQCTPDLRPGAGARQSGSADRCAPEPLSRRARGGAAATAQGNGEMHERVLRGQRHQARENPSRACAIGIFYRSDAMTPIKRRWR